MAGVLSAFVLGAVLLLLGLYLLFGPMFSNEDETMQAGRYVGYALPAWDYFPLGVAVEVAWSAMDPGSNVTARSCAAVTNGICTSPGAPVGLGTGVDGSFTFQAQPGQLYGIVASSPGILTVHVSYSSLYGAVLFVVFTLGVIAIAIGFMRNAMGIERFRPI